MSDWHDLGLGNYSPYYPIQVLGGDFGIDETNPALRALLLNMAKHQTASLIRVIEQNQTDKFPPAVRGMGQENPHTLKTLLNMLSAYHRFLVEEQHSDVREKLAVIFRPMRVWVHGQDCVSCPALLVIQSILYSHCEWFREELFESHSAVRAFKELGLLGFSDKDRYFIAAIIAHQTLLRASWSIDPDKEPPEILAIYEKQSAWDYAIPQKADPEKNNPKSDEHTQAVGFALQKTLQRFVEKINAVEREEDFSLTDSAKTSRVTLSAALVLHALCLQSRHSRYESEAMTQIKPLALNSMDSLLAKVIEDKFRSVRLVFFHYGRYVYQATKDKPNDNLYKQAGDFIKSVVTQQISSDENISFCFQRVASKKLWKKIEKIEPSPRPDQPTILTPRPMPWRPSSLDGIEQLVQPTVGGTFYKLKLDGARSLQWMLGLDDSAYAIITLWMDGQGETISTIEEILNLIYKNTYKPCLWRGVGKKLKYITDRYFPAPLVGMVLRLMRDLCPKAFTPLHIICRGKGGNPVSDPHWEDQFTLWLPKSPTSDQSPSLIWDGVKEEEDHQQEVPNNKPESVLTRRAGLAVDDRLNFLNPPSSFLRLKWATIAFCPRRGALC